MSNGIIKEECTGVYVGTLLEDMTDTVERTHKLYCDVYIPDFYSKDYGHPLTLVPLWAMSLPLKKGDKVLVKFNQENLLFPELYKNPTEIDEGFYKQFDVSKVSVKSSKTVGATKLGENSYVIKTDDYTVIHQNNGFVLMDKNDNVYIYGNNVNVICDKFSVKNTTASLYNVLNSMLNVLNTNLATQGSPAAHIVVPGQFNNVITELNGIMK